MVSKDYKLSSRHHSIGDNCSNVDLPAMTTKKWELPKKGYKITTSLSRAVLGIHVCFHRTADVVEPDVCKPWFRDSFKHTANIYEHLLEARHCRLALRKDGEKDK